MSKVLYEWKFVLITSSNQLGPSMMYMREDLS